MSRASTQTPGQETYIGAERFADLILEDFPEPGERFQRSDLESQPAKRLLRNLADRGVVTVVDHDEDGYFVYETDPDAHEIATATVEERDPLLPCEHSGLISLRDGRGFICSYRGCSTIHSREEVEAWRAER